MEVYHRLNEIAAGSGLAIVQLKENSPSHIVLPAIHLKKEEIGALFHEKIGTQAGASDPTYLTHAARESLRQDFLSADAAMTAIEMVSLLRQLDA